MKRFMIGPNRNFPLCQQSSLVLSVLIVLSGCSGTDGGTPIARGVHITPPLVEQPDSEGAVSVDAEDVLSVKKMPLTDLDRVNSQIQTDVSKPELPADHQARLEARQQQSLNLTLPDMQWSDEVVASPKLLPDDMFNRQSAASRVGVSGKLYWDESEKDTTETKPLSDTITGMSESITGGEVELQIRLP
jgi:hypothetical protein